MSRVAKKKGGGRTTRKKQPSRETLDEDENQQTVTDEKKDPILTAAEKSVRKLVAWITKTQTTGGLNDFYNRNIDKLAPDNAAAAAFNANKLKARKQDIPCIDESRVKLKEIDAAKDFIHANYIKSPPSDRVYIATQHPLESTFEDFWRMVFYENCDTLISLSATEENLPPYYPNEVGKYANHGAFFVNCRKVTPPAARYTPTEYQIEVLPEGCSNSRIIKLLHYPHWNNTLPVNSRVVLKALRLVKVDKTTNGAVIVQCSNGISRSCCLIMADVIIDLIFRNTDVDVLALMKKFRNQRQGFIDNKTHFAYALYLFTEYVKIRCKKFKVFPDIVKEIDTVHESLNKEFGSLLSKEPKIKESKNATIEQD